MSAGVKVPRTLSCVVVLDSAVADDYDAAVAAYQAQERELSSSFIRRAAATHPVVVVQHRLDWGASEESAAALEALVAADRAVLADLVAVRDAASKALEAVRQRWTFRSLGRKAWKALVDAHPTTDATNELWQAEGGAGPAPYDFDALGPDLIAAAVVTPAVTPAQVAAMFDGDDWNDAEIQTLYQTAVLAQTSARSDPKARR